MRVETESVLIGIGAGPAPALCTASPQNLDTSAPILEVARGEVRLYLLLISEEWNYYCRSTMS